MSDQWNGGKGDKSRISDPHEYRTNYDKIFRKTTGYKLFLDDYRDPKDAYLHDLTKTLLYVSSTRRWDWEIVRSYEAFVKMIDTKGIPDVVSFDNDLTEKHLNAYHNALAINKYEWDHLEGTGIHCALYLLDKCKELNVPFPKYYVHSANHYARPIIKQLIDGN